MLFRRLAAVTYSIPTPVLVRFGNPNSLNGLGRPRISAYFLSSPTFRKLRSSEPAFTTVSPKNVGEKLCVHEATPLSFRMGRKLPFAAKSSVVGELLLPL